MQYCFQFKWFKIYPYCFTFQILTNGDLFIRDLKWSHLGTYDCIAENVHGEARTEVFLYPAVVSDFVFLINSYFLKSSLWCEVCLTMLRRSLQKIKMYLIHINKMQINKQKLKLLYALFWKLIFNPSYFTDNILVISTS